MTQRENLFRERLEEIQSKYQGYFDRNMPNTKISEEFIYDLSNGSIKFFNPEDLPKTIQDDIVKVFAESFSS